MRSFPRLATQRGLGPDADEITDDDILEVDGAKSTRSPPSTRVTCPPPSSSLRAATRYSFVAPRRQTLSMGNVAGDGPVSRRTLQLDYVSCPTGT